MGQARRRKQLQAAALYVPEQLAVERSEHDEAFGRAVGRARRTRLTAETAAVSTPLGRVGLLHDQRQAVDQAFARAVVDARTSGATWQQIGSMCGVSRQVARERWHRLPTPAGHTIHHTRSVSGEPAQTRRSAGLQPDAS